MRRESTKNDREQESLSRKLKDGNVYVTTLLVTLTNGEQATIPHSAAYPMAIVRESCYDSKSAQTFRVLHQSYPRLPLIYIYKFWKGGSSFVVSNGVESTATTSEDSDDCNLYAGMGEGVESGGGIGGSNE